MQYDIIMHFIKTLIMYYTIYIFFNTIEICLHKNIKYI